MLLSEVEEKCLFRYRYFNKSTTKEILNKEIWHSDVKNLNDPFEFPINLDWSEIDKKDKGLLTKYAMHYLAGTLHSDTGRVHYVGGSKKCSDLFINLLETLRRTYRRAKTITLVVDNYIIHKSRKVERWLEKNTKFRLLCLPTYSPWLNPIELLWLSLHETVTRNHQ